MLALFTYSPNYFLQIRVQFFSYTIVGQPRMKKQLDLKAKNFRLNWFP